MSAMNKLLFSLGRYTQMVPRRGQKFSFWGVSRPLILLCALIGFAESASALPSYARQTGYACIKCHVGGFGPQLTPYGVKFKIADCRFNASYCYNQTYGFTIGRFSKHGQPDP